jgi:hypothetical protein
MSQGRSEEFHQFEAMKQGEMGGHVARTGNMKFRYKLLDGGFSARDHIKE